MTPKRFELAPRFWEIARDKTRVTTTAGKIGTAGSPTVIRCGSVEEARSTYQRLIAKKQGEGYRYAGPEVTTLDPREPRLEAAIANDPDDRDAYHVYADWLSERGDPRGELISLHLAMETAADDQVAHTQLEHAAATVIADHAEYLLGPLAETRHGEVELTWRRGFFGEVSIPQRFAALAAHPSSRFLIGLALEGSGDVTPAIDTLIARLVPMTLRSLELAVTSATMAAISETAWPSLRSLVLGCGRLRDGDLSLLLHSPNVPQLRRLTLRDVAFADALCVELRRSELLLQLEELAITESEMTAAGAAALHAHRERFAHLDILDVSDNLLEPDACAMLQPIASKVLTHDQFFHRDL